MRVFLRLGVSTTKFALMLLLSFGFSAQAANILFASTKEVVADAITANNNLYNAYQSNPNNTVTDARDTLGFLSTTDKPDFSGYDVVVVTATYESVEADEQDALIKAINSRASKSFIVIYDGCCGNGRPARPGPAYVNVERTIELLSSVILIAPTPSISGGYTGGGRKDFTLTDSPYRDSFTSLPVIKGAYFGSFTGLPSENVLYTDPASQAVAAFLPEADTKGACVFAMGDISPFSVAPQPQQSELFAEASINAITGSCKKVNPDSIVTQKVPVTQWQALLIMTMVLLSAIGWYRRKSQ